MLKSLNIPLEYDALRIAYLINCLENLSSLSKISAGSNTKLKESDQWKGAFQFCR